MTGWRLGWLVVPEALVPVIERLAQNLFICASTVAQHAALACFEPESLAEYERRRAEFKARRDYFIPELNRLGLTVPVMPDGAFYAWADCTSAAARLGVSGSWDFAFELMKRAHLAVTPGRDFGHADTGAVCPFFHRQFDGAAAGSRGAAGGCAWLMQRGQHPSATLPAGQCASTGKTPTPAASCSTPTTSSFLNARAPNGSDHWALNSSNCKDSTGGMFVVTETTIRYHRPARLDDELIVTASMIETGRASMTVKHKALLKTEQPGEHPATLLCEGTIRIGWVHGASLQPRRIPASILDSLKTWIKKLQHEPRPLHCQSPSPRQLGGPGRGRAADRHFDCQLGRDFPQDRWRSSAPSSSTTSSTVTSGRAPA